MSVSILFSDAPVGSVSKDTLADLGVDKIFGNIISDPAQYKYLMQVLASPLTDEYSVELRRELIAVFYEDSDLLDGLSDLFSRLWDLQNEQKDFARNARTLRSDGLSSVESEISLLESNAVCLKRSLHILEAIEKLLDDVPTEATSLKVLQSALQDICKADAFDRAITFCTRFENISVTDPANLKVTVSADGVIESVSLIDGKYVDIADPDDRKWGFYLFKKINDVFDNNVAITPAENGYYDDLVCKAISELSDGISSVCQQIFEKFANIHREFDFYFAAIEFVKWLEQHSVDYIYASHSYSAVSEFEDLRDLYLLVNMSDKSAVVGNDITFGNGVVIMGDNGCGKTSFLRSLGLAHILTQAGLPVCAAVADVLYYNNIESLFAESERDADIGRFEQEVAQMAELVDCVGEHSLVLLNEPFQSTFYEDGARGLYHILHYFSNMHTDWVLVTHLKKITEILSSSQANVYAVGPDHKLVICN